MNIILFSSMNIPVSTTLKHYYKQAWNKKLNNDGRCHKSECSTGDYKSTKISTGVIMKNTEILDHLKTKKICKHAVEKWLS